MIRSTSLSVFRRIPRGPRSTRFMGSPSSTNVSQTSAPEVFGTAQRHVERMLEKAKGALRPAGERVGVMLGSYRQPLLYNIAVARELLKQIYITENLAPPRSLSTVLDAYRTLWGRARDSAYLRNLLATGEWARLAIYCVEAYGIFKIGEIVGRRSLVGYTLH